MTFNKEQDLIIKDIWGAHLINAPVGTGKTTILTERIVEAIKKGIRADEILALSFTNKAAEEMKSRIKKRIDDKNDFDALIISTFHSFCSYFLKAEAKNIAINPNFLILDQDEQLSLAKKILKNNKDIYWEKDRELLNILDLYYKYRLSLLQIEIGHKISPKKMDPKLIAFAEEYVKELKQKNSFDFNELVLTCLQALSLNPEIKEKWANRFRFIQLDEFQDSHISEYLVIKELAKKHKNVSFIGDIDQTIYSFRDSQPFFIAKLFKEHFKPVKERSLTTNYRSNPKLIEAYISLLKNIENHQTKKLNSNVLKDKSEERLIELFRAYNFSGEVLWTIDKIKEIRESDSRAKIAVLNRANFSINLIADVFSENNISFLTVDQYDFFKRQEVKDIFAYLKILFNKSDFFSAQRIVGQSASLDKINNEARLWGLNISDFLNFKNYNLKEPFSELLEQSQKGRMIVLDTETTGINPSSDNIVQIYAREIIDGKLGQEFHYYLKSDKAVGSSYFVHKISDEFLDEKGEDPRDVLKKLNKFISNSIIVGHNILFDLNMIKENAKRQGLKFTFNNYYDTLDLSRRFLNLDSYKLSNISKHLKFQIATHSADDDVGATIELLFYIIKKLKKNSEERSEFWNKLKSKFIKTSSQIFNWEKEIDKLRPAELLEFLWEESGLKESYKKEAQREKSFKTLKHFFENKDNIKLDSRSSLHDLIHYSSLVKNIDFLGLEQGKIPIVTIHQVKGLEFDYIFLLGLNEGSFPLFKSDNLEEEKRLFYVALTRAKKKAFLSYSSFKNDYPLRKSSLINLIDREYIKEF